MIKVSDEPLLFTTSIVSVVLITLMLIGCAGTQEGDGGRRHGKAIIGGLGGATAGGLIAAALHGGTAGIIGGALAVITALTVNAFFRMIVFEHSLASAFIAPTVVLVDVIRVIFAFAVGLLSNQTQQSNQEILERENLEKERQAYMGFLVLLNNITRAALESDDLSAMLQTLANRMGELFGTDNSFITLWDDDRQLTKPIAAFGPQSSSFLSVQFEPGESTLTEHVLSSGQVLSIFDVTTSPYVNLQKEPKVYPGSILILPLVPMHR